MSAAVCDGRDGRSPTIPTTDPTLEGPSWSAPLNITYAWGDATTQSFVNSAGTFTSAITGAYQTLVQTAMHAWEAVTNVHFTLLSSTSGANIDIGWMNFTATAGQLGVTQYADYTDGTTNRDTFVSGTFVGFEDPAYRAVGSDQTSLYSGYNTTLYQVILHELGHALGLAHVSDATMLMNPTLGASDRGISAGDVTNIQKIYGAPGSGTPSVPTTTATIVAFSADRGTSSTDFVTNVPAQTVTATLSAALASGESLMGSVNGGTTWTNITAYVSGTGVSWTGLTLSGISSIAMRVTNATGNGTIAYQSYTIDTTPPTTTAGSIQVSADSGSSSTDLVTNVAAQTVTATLSAWLVSGEKLYGSTSGGLAWTDVTSKVSGTTVSWTGVTLQAGTSAIAFRVGDLAGNFGPTTSQAYTLDTVAPTVGFNGLQLSADSGTSPTDFVTNVAGQTVTGILGSPLAAGDKLFGSVNGGTTWTDITSKVVGTALSWNGVTLGAGTSSIQLKVVDPAGNTGAVTSQVYTLDVTPPTTAVTGIAISADSGASVTDLVTNVAAQTITATLGAALAPGDRLYGSVDGGTTWADVTNKVSGTSVSWSGATLLSGTRNVAFRVVDLAGNAGPTSTKVYTLDVTPPTAAVTGPIALSIDSGVVGDFVTNVVNQSISASLDGALSAGDRLLGSTNGGAPEQPHALESMTSRRTLPMSDPTTLRAGVGALHLHSLLAHWSEVASPDWLVALLDWEEQERGRRSLQRRLEDARIGRFKQSCDFDWTCPKRCDPGAVQASMLPVSRVESNGVGKSTPVIARLAFVSIVSIQTRYKVLLHRSNPAWLAGHQRLLNSSGTP